jgi:hypothetical protein
MPMYATNRKNPDRRDPAPPDGSSLRSRHAKPLQATRADWPAQRLATHSVIDHMTVDRNRHNSVAKRPAAGFGCGD